jgi:aminoglycoside phosphotransferase family enzyme/predicted kinase
MAPRPDQVKTDLLRPGAFAAIAPACSVSLIETHISWVFVLDRDVLKVKRPVDLGFLDFRSCEQRRLACEEEVRLNARLAPGVYRGVVPVTLELDGRCVVGGLGLVVDWAVHMERMSDARRADHLLGEGQLTPRRIDAIAATIAEFHRDARSDAEVTRLGDPAAIARNVEENFDQTRSSLGRYLSPQESEEIVRWQTRFVRDERERFMKRIAQRRIVEGHGDLRLEHVYLEESGTIRVLDCIEFNERFRYADACADIAFLSMDLARAGRVDLAERLLAAYAREADDYELYSVVDFYESYRAFVRGKIAAMLENDGGVEPAARERAAKEARRYFLLALSRGRPSLVNPIVIAVGGVIASGKSAVANRLSGELGAPVIEADRTRKAMLGVPPLRRLEGPAWSGAYDEPISDQVYAELLRRAAIVVESRRPVILDASFRSAALRRAARDLAASRGVPFRLIECRATPEVCRERLVAREREPSVSDGRLAIFDAFCARFEPIVELPPGEHIVLDTTAALDDTVDELRRRLFD